MTQILKAGRKKKTADPAKTPSNNSKDTEFQFSDMLDAQDNQYFTDYSANVRLNNSATYAIWHGMTNSELHDMWLEALSEVTGYGYGYVDRSNPLTEVRLSILRDYIEFGMVKQRNDFSRIKSKSSGYSDKQILGLVLRNATSAFQNTSGDPDNLETYITKYNDQLMGVGKKKPGDMDALDRLLSLKGKKGKMVDAFAGKSPAAIDRIYELAQIQDSLLNVYGSNRYTDPPKQKLYSILGEGARIKDENGKVFEIVMGANGKLRSNRIKQAQLDDEADARFEREMNEGMDRLQAKINDVTDSKGIKSIPGVGEGLSGEVEVKDETAEDTAIDPEIETARKKVLDLIYQGKTPETIKRKQKKL